MKLSEIGFLSENINFSPNTIHNTEADEYAEKESEKYKDYPEDFTPVIKSIPEDEPTAFKFEPDELDQKSEGYLGMIRLKKLAGLIDPDKD